MCIEHKKEYKCGCTVVRTVPCRERQHPVQKPAFAAVLLCAVTNAIHRTSKHLQKLDRPCDECAQRHSTRHLAAGRPVAIKQSDKRLPTRQPNPLPRPAPQAEHRSARQPNPLPGLAPQAKHRSARAQDHMVPPEKNKHVTRTDPLGRRHMGGLAEAGSIQIGQLSQVPANPTLKGAEVASFDYMFESTPLDPEGEKKFKWESEDLVTSYKECVHHKPSESEYWPRKVMETLVRRYPWTDKTHVGDSVKHDYPEVMEPHRVQSQEGLLQSAAVEVEQRVHHQNKLRTPIYTSSGGVQASQHSRSRRSHLEAPGTSASHDQAVRQASSLPRSPTRAVPIRSQQPIATNLRSEPQKPKKARFQNQAESSQSPDTKYFRMDPYQTIREPLSYQEISSLAGDSILDGEPVPEGWQMMEDHQGTRHWFDHHRNLRLKLFAENPSGGRT